MCCLFVWISDNTPWQAAYWKTHWTWGGGYKTNFCYFLSLRFYRNIMDQLPCTFLVETSKRRFTLYFLDISRIWSWFNDWSQSNAYLEIFYRKKHTYMVSIFYVYSSYHFSNCMEKLDANVLPWGDKIILGKSAPIKPAQTGDKSRFNRLHSIFKGLCFVISKILYLTFPKQLKEC